MGVGVGVGVEVIGLVRLKLFRRRNSLSTRTHVVYVDPRVGSVIVYDNPLHRLYTLHCYSSSSQIQVRSYDPDLRTVRSDYGSAASHGGYPAASPTERVYWC